MEKLYSLPEHADLVYLGSKSHGSVVQHRERPMSAQYEKSAAVYLEPKNMLRLFNRVSRAIRISKDEKTMLSTAAHTIGADLGLDRCVIMLVDDSENVLEAANLRVAAEFYAADLKSLSANHYKLKSNSEIYRLLLQGRPVPLKDVVPAESAPNRDQDLEQFGRDSNSKSLIAFPLVEFDKVIGFVSMHYCKEPQGFSEELLEFGEAVSEELLMALDRAKALSQREVEGRIFNNTSFPALVLDNLGRVKKYNDACQQLLSTSRKDLTNQSILDLIPDGQRLLDTMRGLSKSKANATVGSVLVSQSDGRSSHVDVCISSLSKTGEKSDVLIMLVPSATKQDAKSASSEADAGKSSQTEELANNLSRQLSWERWVRQIICKLHATLDRDTLLQTVVDGFGRALGASRCLIVRTDGPASPLVTHEYAEPDISPLGLGRTGQFPTVAVSYFRHKVASIPDLAALERTHELSQEEYEYFADNGIKSMAGAPITSHGISFGVIIILESGPSRKWTPHELDMLEVAATQTAVALAHSQQYLQLKDQLFNMNLLGNLTQQLTNTLELVSRSKIESTEEKRPVGNSPPLSLRELEVLKLIASGLANREIAQRLFLTESTVELHASRIRKKLKLKSRTALVKYACDNGLA
jgi:GAF domain-containing protein